MLVKFNGKIVDVLTIKQRRDLRLRLRELLKSFNKKDEKKD